MTTIQLPTEFKEFFQLLNNRGVKYLLVGGYAIAYYGFPRATGDIDIWVGADSENIKKLEQVLRDFGLSFQISPEEPFLREGQFIRIGNPPLRIDLLTQISGVLFQDCYQRKKTELLDNVSIFLISLEDLKVNKKAAARHKDLNDLENLP